LKSFNFQFSVFINIELIPINKIPIDRIPKYIGVSCFKERKPLTGEFDLSTIEISIFGSFS